MKLGESRTKIVKQDDLYKMTENVEIVRWIELPASVLFLLIPALGECNGRRRIGAWERNNDGVCRDAKGNDCSKEAFERSLKVCEAPDRSTQRTPKRMHIQGKVVLSLSISNEGCAENIRVVRGGGYGLDQSAVYALERFRWQRPKKPINYVTIEFNFDPIYHSLLARNAHPVIQTIRRGSK
jgi:TonB family protein